MHSLQHSEKFSLVGIHFICNKLETDKSLPKKNKYLDVNHRILKIVIKYKQMIVICFFFERHRSKY